MKPHLLLIGYTVEAISTLLEFIHPPQPPANYKDPATIQKWRDGEGLRKLAEAQQDAAYGKLTGRLTKILAVDPAGTGVFNSLEASAESPVEQFLTWLEYRFGKLSELFPSCPEERVDPKILFFGFDPKQFTRVLGTEAMLTTERRIPLGLWYQNETVYDPYDMLVENSRRSSLDLHGLLRLLQISPQMPDWAPHVDPLHDVRIAAEMLYRYQLYPPTFESEELTNAENFKALLARMSVPVAVEEVAEEPSAALDPDDELGQNDPEAGEESPALEEAVEEEESEPAPPTHPARTRRRTPAAEQAG